MRATLFNEAGQGEGSGEKDSFGQILIVSGDEGEDDYGAVLESVKYRENLNK